MPPVVAAPVGAAPGMRHVVWQLAACELRAIMQLVTIEVCATWTLAAACPAEWHSAIANPAPKIERAIAPQRMMHFLSVSIIAPGGARGNVPARSLS
ncbi:MAG: hypothetical protein WBG18_07780 [Xanthobacteraceae bacterium]